jgi:alginate O-acetyltransferase complex protein AlgJ
MTILVPYLHRELQAKKELGTTAVRPALAALFGGFVVGLLIAVPLLQLSADRPFPSLPQGLDGGSLHRFETALEEESWVVAELLPPVQGVLTSTLGQGNLQVYVGRDGWLFLRAGVDALTGPGFLDPATLELRRRGGEQWTAPVQPDPRPALAAFRRELAARGIRLVVVPVPDKAAIHPEKLSRRSVKAPLSNPSWPELASWLDGQGIAVFDPAPILAGVAAPAAAPRYLATDTHWTPEAMDAVARALARDLARHLEPRSRLAYVEWEERIAGLGDLARMLELPQGQKLYAPQSVTVRRVLAPDGSDVSPWQPDPEAQVLLLGDSFTNVFAREDLGWGTGAGLAERLSFHLGQPVDRIAINAGGAHASREALARDLAAGRDRLTGKRVVVYQFADRELAVGDWRILGDLQ